jgi:hypothetical protein
MNTATIIAFLIGSSLGTCLGVLALALVSINHIERREIER